MRRSSAMKIAHMQSDGNAAIVRRAYEAFNTADIATLAKLFDSNTSWHTPGRSSLAGDRKGRDAVFTQFGRYGGETRGTFRANLLNVLESEDGRAVAVHHTSAERNGRRLDVLCCIVFELHNGRILIGREHFYDLYAWDAFWS
jgi:ketosteroid isomerase-like protein